MKMKSMGRALAALLALAAGPASAQGYLWTMTELYSNADGSVQFLELETFTDGAEFVTGETLTSFVGGLTYQFTFPNDLPGFTAGQKMLVATEGFVSLGLVRPDYVVPDGFFSVTGGTLNLAGVQVWVYPALPVDGTRSLDVGGTTPTNSPMNFAGATGTISLHAALNFQALWWGSPAGSESGWGLNVTHQGDVLFATWFTYDLDGSAMWLVAPDTRRTAGNSFAGPLYRTTGPAFSHFDPAGIGVTQVGVASFAFAEDGAAMFSYTVNGVSQSKAITRQVFDAGVSVCLAGGAAGALPNYQDLWWRAPAGSESGWGVNLTHQGDILFATWFTYDAAGKGMWIVMPAGRRVGATSTYAGKLYRTTGAPFNASPWDPASVQVFEVGTGSFAFSGSDAGLFTYSVNGISQIKAITRQVYAAPTTFCR
jgi:hypothetical protein